MKNIVIAAGYATRLYPLTKNFPKPLLQIGGSTILGRLIEDLDSVEDINEHLIVTNHKFADTFRKWAKEQQTKNPVTILDDGTETNETRLGAVRDLLLVLRECRVDEDLLAIAADNLLDFSFRGFIDFFKEKRTSVLMCHYEPELSKLRRTGVIAMDENGKVLEMQEKPETPVSHWAVPPFYLYKKDDLPLIRDCLTHGCGYDAPGDLVRYLCGKTPIHAYPMPGKRYDIGSLDSYEEAKLRFREETQPKKLNL